MCIRFFFGKINLRQFVFFRCNNNIHRRVVVGSSSGRRRVVQLYPFELSV
jgi:hypothetical protein